MREQAYSDFQKELSASTLSKPVPLRVLFELSYRCNFNCVHCYIPPEDRNQKRETRRQKELTAKEVFSILGQLKDKGCFHLGFSGGEIFLRKDIFDILWYAKRLGFNLIILTNGSLIDKRAADELKRLSPNKIDITFHSMNRGNFERITRLRGSYQKVRQALRLLHQRKIPLGIKNCALEYNKGDIKEVDKFSQRLGALARLGSTVLPRLDHSCQPVQYSAEIEPILDSPLLDRQEKKARLLKPKVFKKGKVLICKVGTQSLTINPYGQAKLCPSIDYPNFSILKYGLSRVWRKLNEIARQIENDEGMECRDCFLSPYCSWCPAQSWLTFSNFTQCVPGLKRQAMTNFRLRQTRG